MNPNQPGGYHPYQNNYKPNQFTPYQYNNQQQYNHSSNNNNNLNLPIQSHTFTQQGNHSPSQNNFLNRPKIDRAMYSSTIQSLGPSKNFTFGKLQSMGRFVGGNQQPKNDHNKFIPDNNMYLGQQKQFNYQQNHDQKMKSYERFTPVNQNNESNQFPVHNSHQKSHIHTSNQGYNPQDYNNTQQTKPLPTNQTPQQKRRRQILAIKQQLEMINKKMQSANMNKRLANQQQKNDMKFVPNQGSSLMGNNNNNYLNTNFNVNENKNFNNNSNSYGMGQNNNNNLGSGLQFNKSNQLGTGGYQRNRGLATQSMIVSNQPSSNYKYQSIFDKYDSLKKPTYQTTEAPKQQRGLLLDKFVNKGPGFQQNSSLNNINKPHEVSQTTSIEFKNSLGIGLNSNSNSNSSFNSNSFNLNSGLSSNSSNQYNNHLNTNQSNNFNKKINDYTSFSSKTSSSSSYGSNSTSSSVNNDIQQHNNTNNIATYEPPKQTLGMDNKGLGVGGGMFKKKKQNPYLDDINNNKFQYTTLPTSPKSNMTSTNVNSTQQTTNTFKKNKSPLYEENIVTNAMKTMNIQQSVQFKRDDFIVGKKLGKGQFGQVMLVQHKKTGFLCGMKVMQKKQIRDQKYQGQITRQLSIQFYLAHRNITPLYGYFQDQKNVYLLIEYCTGGQLLEMLRKNRRMEEPEVSRIIRQIIEGIDYIHKELIIHRDIKPQNILFNFGVAKICDFGWAVYKGHGMRKTASVGSPLYYSPEIVMGVQYDEKIDIWDIGMMTYQCLLGKIPFRIYSQLDLNRIVQDQIKFPQYIDTSQQAKDFILKIMKKKPQQRMQIRQMLRHPFITKYPDPKLPVQIMKDFKQILSA